MILVMTHWVTKNQDIYITIYNLLIYFHIEMIQTKLKVCTAFCQNQQVIICVHVLNLIKKKSYLLDKFGHVIYVRECN